MWRTSAVSSSSANAPAMREFHKSATRACGRAMRRISRRDASTSNQWNACATVTRSTDASGNVVASAVPFTTVTPGAGSSAPRMSAFGSTASTRAPSAASSREKMPVPAPRSATTAPGVTASASIAARG
jgi:hypothetical protein